MIKTIIYRHYHLIAILLALLLSACQDNERIREVKHFVEETKRQAMQSNSQIVPTKYELPQPVVYHPTGYMSNVKTNASGTSGVSSPILMYPLKSLQFVGTLIQDNRIFAYVLTPDGMMYLLKVGDAIGNNYGKIMKIDSDHVEVLEGKPAEGNAQSAGQIVTMELKN